MNRRIPPGPGQESVWDYPRPPRLEPEPRRIRIWFDGELLADTVRAYRVLETSHPPVYYLPPEDVKMELLEEASGGSFCEWKGMARYWTVAHGERKADRAAWSYAHPLPPFARLAGHLAFYAGPMDRCEVGEARAMPQPGGFYGGWVTPWVVGPFKGGAGSWGW
jgi:uncharacterized protein (DUF427 family)